MHDSEEVRIMRQSLPSEIKTLEQQLFEQSGFVFIANFDPKTPEYQQFIQASSMDWWAIIIGNAYNAYGESLLRLRALYGFPWHE